MGLRIARLDVIYVNVLRGFNVFLAEIADEAVLPYPCDYLPTLFLIIRVVEDFLFCFSVRIAIAYQVACRRYLPPVCLAVGLTWQGSPPAF